MITAGAIFAVILGAFIFAVLPQAGIARRVVSVGVFLALIVMVYGGAIELLGRPKPLTLEWRSPSNVQVLSAAPVENKAIYVWLSLPGSSEPRAYTLPWSQKSAQELQDAMNKAEADGTEVKMAMLTEGSRQDGEPMFYAAPQPSLPEKDYGSSPVANVYEQP